MARRATLTLLLIVTALVYAGVWTMPFHYEDANWLGDVSYAPTLTLPGRGLTRATFYLTWLVAGWNPGWYHLGNVAVHLVNGLLVYAIGAALWSPAAAVAGSAVFLLHPLNSEAVMYVTGRMDLLMTLGVLLAVWGALRPGWWSLPVIASGALIAGTSKEIGVTALPLVALTLVIWRRAAWQTTYAVSACLIGLSAVIGHRLALILSWWDIPAALGGASVDRGTYAVLQLTALWHLLALVVWPVGFSIDHDIAAMSIASQINAVALSALAVGLIAATWRVLPTLAWSLAWVAVCVLPRCLFLTNEFLREPHMYAPMVGISLGLGSCWCAAWARLARRADMKDAYA